VHPAHRPRYEVTYRYRSATYPIVVENPHGLERGTAQVSVDGAEPTDGLVPLAGDGQRHEVQVVLRGEVSG
jgi:hypothetical protein